jgi:excisionase family DNA binding protein
MDKDAIKSWYTISELADQIGMSRKTVWGWVRDKKLKSERYGAQHRISECTWQQFLADCNTK